MENNNVENTVNITWLKESVERIEKKQDDLSKEMTNGFKGVYARQDKTNGRVNDNCRDITSLSIHLFWVWGVTALIGGAVIYVVIKLFDLLFL